MKTLTFDEQIEKSYDYIGRVFATQKRLVTFDDIYGDGTIHGRLTKDQVQTIYDTIISLL